MKHLSTAIAVLVLLAGCVDTEGMGPGSEPDPAPQADDAEEDATDEEETDAEEETDDDLDTDEPDDEEMEQTAQVFDDPFVWEQEGIRISVTGIGINRIDERTPDDVTRALEDDTNTVLVLDVTASNDHGEAIDLYPSQGEIQVGREQVDAAMWLGDPIAGSGMRDGTDDSGEVFWELTSDYDDVAAEGALDYIVTGPSNAETYDRVIDGDIELAVEWDVG